MQGRRNAIGGPYLSVHLRRHDFLIGRSSTVPTIASAAFQLKNKLDKLGLKFLFVATDATQEGKLSLNVLKILINNMSIDHSSLFRI